MPIEKDGAQLWVSDSQIAGHNIQIGFAGGDVNVTINSAAETSQRSYPRSYIADQLKRECFKRRDLLRRLPGLTDEQVAISRTFDLVVPEPLTDMSAGSVVALVGPMGAGKSETANLWLIDQSQNFAVNDNAPLPLWVAARDIPGDLESWIVDRVDASILTSVGVSLVVDGIDETSKTSQLVDQCEIISVRWPNSRILITGRPGTFPDQINSVQLEGWPEDSALEMIRKVTGVQQLYSGSFPPQIRDAIKRPLFAMLVASIYGKGDVPKTSAGLIQECAVKSLERNNGSWRNAFPILRRIAVASVSNDGNVALAAIGGEAVRHHLRDTRLVTFSAHKASFTLRLFEQWFAAEALLQGEVTLESTICDISSFAKWRYVLALAVQTGSVDQVDTIMRSLAEWNPGAASWVIQKGIEKPFTGSAYGDLPGWREVASRLHRVTASWCLGLGRLAPAATPVDAGQSAEHLRLSLAVEDEGNSFIYAWQKRTAGTPPISYLSDPRALMETGIGIGSSPAPHGDNWVWSWSLDQMRRRLEKNLANLIPVEAPSGGILEEEYVWAVIYALLRRGSRLRADPIDTAEMRDLIAATRREIHKRGPVENYAIQHGGGRRVTRLDLILVTEWLERQQESQLTPPWPPADISNPTGGWVWNFYTPDRLLELTKAVYEGALRAYTELTRTLFAEFSFTLAHATSLPATLRGNLYVPDGDSWADSPTLEYCLIPAVDTELKESQADITLERSKEVRIADEYDRYSAYLKRFRIDNPERAPFSVYGYTHTVLRVWDSRPATNIAFRWIWSDLKSLGWVSHLPRDLK